MYSAALPNGTAWDLPTALNAVRSRWAVYSRNEILAMALQGLFYALLSFAETLTDRPAPQDSRELATWFLESAVGKTVLTELNVESWQALVEKVKKAQPSLADWAADNHEVALMTTIETLGQKAISDEVVGDIVHTAGLTLAALVARPVADEDDYAELTFPAGYFNYFPLNLRAFRALANDTWSKASLAEWLNWILVHWCTDAHLHVALRKLRGQSEDTFRIRPTEQGLLVVNDAPAPEHTNPRFRQARQVLVDLGALEARGNDLFAVTDLGRSLMEGPGD